MNVSSFLEADEFLGEPFIEVDCRGILQLLMPSISCSDLYWGRESREAVSRELLMWGVEVQ